MKWTSTLLILGGTVAIGFVSYLIYNQLHKTKSKNSDTTNIQPEDEITVIDLPHSGETSQLESDFTNQKQSAVKSIYERHNEAGKVFTDAIDTIANSSNDTATIITENSEQLNEIDNNLDDLLN